MSLVNVLILLLVLALTSVIADVWDYTVLSSEGEEVPMAKYNSAKVLIIVNVASNCGYTYSNYRELVDMYDKYHSQGLEILAFPSNQFGEQEPGSDGEIQNFCANFGITFPVMKKIDVNGPMAIELFQYLKENTGGVEINWNFNKFLVIDGKPVKRYGGNIKPHSMLDDILPHLDAGAGDL
jgi:glutathione peroxidase